MSLLVAEKLTCIKRDRILFEALDLSLQAGELLYLRGPNGAGKTSLLRILVGLSEPTEGRVLFEQHCIRKHRDVFGQNTLYFGHKLGVNGKLSAMENLRFWCQLNGVAVNEQQLHQALAQLGLVGLEDVPTQNLSAGQQRRVSLARFWLKQDATLWVLDEPYTALDVQGIALLEKRLLSHLSRGGSVIMTSHQVLSLDYPTRELVLEYNI